MSEMLNCVQILTMANVKVHLDEKSFLFDLIDKQQNNQNELNSQMLLDIKVSGFSESNKSNVDIVDSLNSMN